METVGLQGAADFSDILAEIDKYNEKFRTLISGQRLVVQSIKEIVESIDKEGVATATITAKINDAQVAVYKMNSANEIYGRSIKDITSKLTEEKESIAATSVETQKAAMVQLTTAQSLEQSLQAIKQHAYDRSPGADVTTNDERLAYDRVIAALKTEAVQAGLTGEQLTEMSLQAIRGELVFQESLNGVITGLQREELAANELGAAFIECSLRTEASALKEAAALDKKIALLQRQLAITERQAAVDLQAHQAALKNAQTTLSVRQGVQQITALPRTNDFANQATFTENISFQKGLADLEKLSIQANLTGAQIVQMWHEAANGTLVYDASIGKVQDQLIKLVGTENEVGISAQVAATKQVNAANKAQEAFLQQHLAQTNAAKAIHETGNIYNSDVDTLTEKTKDATLSSQKLTISWQSFIRLVTIQVAHQAISQLAMAIRQATVDAEQFQIRISELRTISQEAGLSFNTWSEGIKKVSDSFGFSILDIAESAYRALSSQVVHGADTFAFMSEAANLARVTMSTLTEATNAMTAATNSFGLKAADAHDVAAKLFVMVTQGNFRLQDFEATLGNVTIIAHEMGLSMEEVFSAVAVTANQGMSVNQSMTQLRGLMTQLAKPSKETREFLDSIGASSIETAFKIYHLGGFFELLKNRVGDTTTELGGMVKNSRGLLEVLTMTNQGAPIYANAMKEMQNANESYAKASVIAMESAGMSLAVETNKVKNYFVTGFGTDIVQSLAKVSVEFGGFEHIIHDGMEVVKVALAAGSAFIIGRIAQIIGTIKELNLAWATSPLGIGVISVAAIETALQVWNNHLEEVGQNIQKDFLALRKFATDLNALQDSLTKTQVNAIDGMLDAALSAVAVSGATNIGKMTEVINVTIANSKVIATEIKEVCEVVIKGLETQLSAVKSEISETDREVKGLAGYLESFDKRWKEFQEQQETSDLAGKPLEQLANLSKHLQEFVKDLKAATTPQQIKEFGDLILDNLKKQEGIQKSVASTAKTNGTDRIKIERQIAEENLRFAKQQMDAQDRLHALHNRVQTQSVKDSEKKVKDDFGAETIIHNEKIANLNAEYKMHEQVAQIQNNIPKKEQEAHNLIDRKTKEVTQTYTRGEESDEYKKLEAKNETINKLMKTVSKQIDDTPDGFDFTKERLENQLDALYKKSGELNHQEQTILDKSKPIAEQKAADIADTSQKIKDLQEATKNEDFDKIMSKGPEENEDKYINRVKEQFATRQNTINRLLGLVSYQMSTLPEMEKAKITAAKKQLEDEQEAYNIRVDKIPEQENLQNSAQASLQKVKDAIANVQASISQQQQETTRYSKIMSEAVENARQEATSDPFGFQRETGQVIPNDYNAQFNMVIDALKTNKSISESGASKEVIEYISKMGGTGFSNKFQVGREESLQKTQEGQTQLKDLMDQSEVLRQKYVEIAKVTETMKASIMTVPEAMKGANLAIATFSSSLTSLAAYIKTIVVPDTPKALKTGASIGFSTTDDGHVKAMAFGGMAGSDMYPAMLGNGEFVMNAASTRKFYSQLISMNANGRINSGSQQNVNVGDVNINMKSSGSESIDVIQLGKLLRREIQRGTVILN